MRRELVLLAIFNCFIFNLIAQPAPDFKVTTTEGIEIELYKDYLDQGKSVMIEIFFVGCPPCRRLAPHMAELHDKMVQQNIAVEFLSMTIMAGDSDEDIAQFKKDFDHDWHFIGHSGGGKEALKVYQDGTYGAYWGTPTTLVIAPDGSVNYNVRGDVNSGEWTDNLEAAIIASQTSFNEGNMPATAVITGQIQDINGSGLAGVNVQLSGGSDTTLVSDETGSFQTSSLLVDAAYDLTLSKTDDPVVGVTTLDIIQISQHILGIAPFDNALQNIAADVNNSGSITSFDLVRIRQLILGIIQAFPDVESWSFEPSSSISLNDLSELESISATGVKKGDVNGSANLLQLESRSSLKFDLLLEEQYFERGDVVSVPIKVADLAAWQGLQFTLGFDPSVLAFNQIEQTNLKDFDVSNFNLLHQDKGLISTSWFTMNPEKQNDLFTIQFIAKESGKISDILSTNSNLTVAEAYDFKGSNAAVNLKVIPGKRGDSGKFTVYPNPVKSNQITLDIANSAFKKLNYAIIGASGKTLKNGQLELTEKDNQRRMINLETIENGVYFIQLMDGEKHIKSLQFIKQ